MEDLLNTIHVQGDSSKSSMGDALYAAGWIVGEFAE